MKAVDGSFDRLYQRVDLYGLQVEELGDGVLLAQRWKWKGEVDGMIDIELLLRGTVLNQIDLIPSGLRIESIREPLRRKASMAPNDHHGCTVRALQILRHHCCYPRVPHANDYCARESPGEEDDMS